MFWTEQLDGHLSFDQTDFNQALMEGKRDGARCALRLTLLIADMGEFGKATHKRAAVQGGVFHSPDLGGRLDVTWGEFELLGQANALFDHLHLRMRYRLNLVDPPGRALRLSGFKLVENDPGRDSWADTTTLFTRIYKGAWRIRKEDFARPDPWAEEDELAEQSPREQLLATGVLRISRAGFLRELTTFRGTEGSWYAKTRDVLRFGGHFTGGLAKAYVGPNISDGRPSFPRDYPRPSWRRDLEGRDWHAAPGRERNETNKEESLVRYALEREIVPFEVDDLAFPLNLHHIRNADASGSGARGPVLLAHGAGVRAAMFYGQPRGETLVDFLLRHGYDVWALNWRGSIDFPNNSYTLDQVARFDHPAAIAKVLEMTGERRVRALVHCQGSVSFLMAAVAGFLPKDPDTKEDLVSHVVSSAVSLFFEVPDRTWTKQRATLPLVTRLATGADPQWGIRAINSAGKVLAQISKLAERPCNNVPCQIANYIYGAGWDVLLCHENVDDEVHAWTARELGYTPFSLISQVAESCRYGHIVPAWASAPPSYVSRRPQIADARFTFLGCTRDTMFEARGQERAAEFLAACEVLADYVPLEGYGHMDAYWGRHAASEVFPAILTGLQWNDERTRPSEQRLKRIEDEKVEKGGGCAPAFQERWRARCQPSTFSEPPPPRSRVS